MAIDGSWTLTEAETEELLSKASLSVILQSIENLAVTLRQKQQLPSQYLPDELIEMLSAEIAQELRRTARVKLGVAPVVAYENAKHARASRRRYGTGHGIIAQLCEQFIAKVPGRELSVEACNNLLTLAQGKPGILMQSFRNVGLFVKTRRHVQVPHAEMLQRIEEAIVKELGKLAAASTQI
jgi:hypothetical protein